MALRKYKPMTAGTRWRIGNAYAEITADVPEKSLLEKVKGLAKVSALSYKVKESKLLVLEDVSLDAPKTKEVASILKSLKAEGKKVLFLTGDENTNLHLSLRNMPNVLGYQFNDMNTYDIVNAEVVVITEASVKAIAEEVKEMSAN